METLKQGEDSHQLGESEGCITYASSSWRKHDLEKAPLQFFILSPNAPRWLCPNLPIQSPPYLLRTRAFEARTLRPRYQLNGWCQQSEEGWITAEVHMWGVSGTEGQSPWIHSNKTHLLESFQHSDAHVLWSNDSVLGNFSDIYPHTSAQRYHARKFTAAFFFFFERERVYASWKTGRRRETERKS